MKSLGYDIPITNISYEIKNKLDKVEREISGEHEKARLLMGVEIRETGRQFSNPWKYQEMFLRNLAESENLEKLISEAFFLVNQWLEKHQTEKTSTPDG